MIKEKETIQDYLKLICSLLIDQFNVRYEHYNIHELKREANERYVERDWVYKIGEYFKDLAYYEIPGERNNQGHHDIGIPSKDFIIEVKYLKNWDSATKTRSASKTWAANEKDFHWLEEEIINGNKNKRAVVLVWCNCLDYFGQVIQFGSGRGTKNPVNKDRLVYFPYLMSSPQNGGVILTKDLKYNYKKKECQLDLNSIGKGNVDMACLFLGDKNDKLHMAIYY